MHFGKLVKYIVKTEACTSAAIWRFCGLFAEFSCGLATINPLAYLEMACSGGFEPPTAWLVDTHLTANFFKIKQLGRRLLYLMPNSAQLHSTHARKTPTEYR